MKPGAHIRVVNYPILGDKTGTVISKLRRSTHLWEVCIDGMLPITNDRRFWLDDRQMTET